MIVHNTQKLSEGVIKMQHFRFVQYWADVERKIYPFYRALGLANTMKEFLQYYQLSRAEIFKIFAPACIKQAIADGKLKREDAKKFNGHAQRAFTEIEKKHYATREFYCNARIWGEYEEAIYINKNGEFEIKPNKFVAIYLKNVQLRTAENQERLQQIANAVNSLFITRVTWEDLNRYFMIKDGFLHPRPSITPEEYAKISSGAPPAEDMPNSEPRP